MVITRTRLTRAAASIAVASGVLLGTAGCVFITPIATLQQYDPSDGINVSIGDIDLRNAIVFLDDETGAASLMITIINNSDSAAAVNLQFESEGETVTLTQQVGGREVVAFGTTPDGEQILILEADARAGGLFSVYVQHGTLPGQELLVPVLPPTGDYEGLGPVIPEPEPTPTPTPVPAETAAPAESTDG